MNAKIFYLWSAIGLIFVSNVVFADIVNMSGSVVVKKSGKCLSVSNASMVNAAAVIQTNCTGANNEQWSLKPSGDAYQIVVKHSGQCLSVNKGLQTNNAQVVQSPCVVTNNALWYVQPKGDYFQIVAKHSGKCLEVFNATQNDGAKIVQYSCNNTDNQSWNVAAYAHTPIQAKHSNQCLDVKDASLGEGAASVQYICHGKPSQQLTLMPYQNAYRVFFKHTGKCLKIPNASTNDGANAIQATCTGSSNELWVPSSNGKYYQLVAKHSNKCLTVNGGSLASGESVIQLACGNGDNQLWKIDISSTTGGKWSEPIKLTIVPVAAAGLPNGKLLLWSSNDRIDYTGGLVGDTYTATFDPITNRATERLVHETGHDMFCPGTANLADGRILVNGGVNSELTSIYNSVTEQWLSGATMNIGRGYQANTPLSNGEIFTLGGSWSGGRGNKNGEVWNSASGWRRTTNIRASSILTNDAQGVYRADNHGWFFGVDKQKVFHAGPSKEMHWFDTTGAGITTPAGTRAADAHSMNGNAVMFDVGKILKLGGAPDYQNTNASTNAYIIDINNGVNVNPVAGLAYARSFSSSVVLPNGQVIVVGGEAFPVPFSDAQAVLAAELWDPNTSTFTTLNSMRVPRAYHSVALLQSDGRIFVGGGGLCGAKCQANHADAEIFTPPYLLNADGTNAIRPAITHSPKVAGYGANIPVTTGSAINQFVLVRVSSVTHAVNNDQRRIPLTFTTTGTNAYSVKIPMSRGVAIPGYYMLFALNSNGVPSIASMIKIG